MRERAMMAGVDSVLAGVGTTLSRHVSSVMRHP
jgi:hypothetical protein